jgi:hypothetical protein
MLVYGGLPKKTSLDHPHYHSSNPAGMISFLLSLLFSRCSWVRILTARTEKVLDTHRELTGKEFVGMGVRNKTLQIFQVP